VHLLHLIWTTIHEAIKPKVHDYQPQLQHHDDHGDLHSQEGCDASSIKSGNKSLFSASSSLSFGSRPDAKCLAG